MIPIRIENATNCLGAPEGWDEEKQGRCQKLWVRHHHDPRFAATVVQSKWELTPDEVKLLAKGGATIMVTLVGSVQPPIALEVQPAVVSPEDHNG